MDELIKDFLQESRENLDHLDQDFVKLESDPNDRELLKSIFRTIHTIKGTCGFLGLAKLEALAHAGENLLSQLRDAVIPLNSERTTALLQMVDAVRQMLDSIETSENEGERDDSALIETLKQLQKSSDEPAAPETTAEDIGAKETASGDVNSQEASGFADTTAEIPAAAKENTTPQEKKGEGEPVRTEAFLGEAVKLLGKVLVERNMATPEDVAVAIQKQLEGDSRQLGEILSERGAVKPQDVAAAVQVQQAAKATIAESTIRVDVRLLDRLMTLVGELVLARNQILQHTQNLENAGLNASSQRLNLITDPVHERLVGFDVTAAGSASPDQGVPDGRALH